MHKPSLRTRRIGALTAVMLLTGALALAGWLPGERNADKPPAAGSAPPAMPAVATDQTSGSPGLPQPAAGTTGERDAEKRIGSRTEDGQLAGAYEPNLAVEALVDELAVVEPSGELRIAAADQDQTWAQEEATEEETLFLTIIGDQTFVRRGPPGSRQPSPEAVATTSGSSGGTNLGVALAPDGSSAAGGPREAPARRTTTGGPASSGTGSSAPALAMNRKSGPAAGGSPAPAEPSGSGAAGSGENYDPFYDPREWPAAACPWTLPPGSDQATADTLRNQYGCRYLSSCYFETGECTYHYQGASS